MSQSSGTSFFTPEGFIMMSLAVSIDAGEVIVGFIPYAGPVLSIILDAIGLVVIGGWAFFRSQLKGGEKPEIPKKGIKQLAKSAGKAGKKIGKAAKWLKRLKWLRPLLLFLEVFPLFEVMPDFIFGWTLLVYLELKYD